MPFLFKHDASSAPLAEPNSASAPTLRDGELAAVYYGERVGGDFYDFIRVSPERVVFGLMDIAGRMERNRPIILAAQQTFRAASAELLKDDSVNEAEAMTELYIQLNRTVLKAADGVCACAAFAGCYNENLGVVCYFNAGHTPGLLHDGTGTSELPATGLPLGLFSHATVDAPMAALQSASALLLVSRGVVEGKKRGEEFGLERVKASLESGSGTSAKELCVGVIDKVTQFMRTPPTHNDVTALALVRSGNA